MVIPSDTCLRALSSVLINFAVRAVWLVTGKEWRVHIHPTVAQNTITANRPLSNTERSEMRQTESRWAMLSSSRHHEALAL